MDRFTALKTFCAAVEAQSFSRAANDICLSRSAVSKNIRELEEYLGVTLIQRSTRGISVTEAGANYYEKVSRMLTSMKGADDEVRQSSTTPCGNLRVSVPLSLGLLYITPLLPTFLERYPDISVEVVLTDSKVDLLQEGFDLAIRGIKRLEDSCTRSRLIGEFTHTICASPDYLARCTAPMCPSDLRRHDVLIYTEVATPDRWKFDSPTNDDPDECIVQVSGRYRSNNSLALRQAAIAGKGILRIPEIYVRDDLEKGHLVPLLQDWSLPTSGIWVIYSQTSFIPNRLRVFIDFLADNFSMNTLPSTPNHIGIT
ncbi:LysR family transcriptional regulator [Chromohalobacter marismortui]|uniref:LysR family transcriptional regulator n=1 Tax=Chromohalobacter marismortui TaxID=42055 RepID=A0A4R7NT14_9GAMM|nr:MULTISPECIES: LysR family transcriptional regulator [Chromohalobacter]MCI0509071.1 LysR family transcriptional regulator [Chromohalobacter sp.]MCI0592824.1 LysR family transcriptional regulator [Chromohalobacter sp.]TDU24038.1 LysR family transcriptional regulator [Chromohalobacter marismortui]